MSAKIDRSQRLREINATLRARNLKPFRKLGDVTQGEIELVGIKEIHDHSARFFTDIKFEARFPSGDRGEYTLRFNANGRVSDGAVMVVLLNGRFVIVKQWRPSVGQWTYELPRGFGEVIDRSRIAGQLGTMSLGNLPLGTLARELGEEVLASADITSVTHLGNVAQDSSVCCIVPSYFLVLIRAEGGDILGRRPKGDEIGRVLLWGQERVLSEIGHRLCDSHTLTGLMLAFRHIEHLPRLC
ncbi:hypothetical protein AMJ57_01915 [Parcubacteria bacterium SG8_24]|nr:MAG: hypothetical protein AMJ57_01915 [Parcubacteria bacterium SG8_24]